MGYSSPHQCFSTICVNAYNFVGFEQFHCFDLVNRNQNIKTNTTTTIQEKL